MSLLSEGILAFTGSLEHLFNRLLQEDPDSLEAVARLEGRIIALDIEGLPRLYLLPGRQGIQLRHLCADNADTTLSGTALAFIRLQQAKHASDSLLSGEIRIEGDTALGQRFRAILDQLEIDWEEVLSRYSGDVIAHQAGQAVRQLTAWGRHALATLQADFREYVQDEESLSPTNDEMQSFSQAVSRLRDDTERLQARMQRLQRQLQDR